MLDTTRVNIQCRGWKIPRGWDCSEGRTKWQKDEVTGESSFVSAQHRETDFRIGGDEHGGTWMEGSLPKLLYGRNDYVLRPEDLPAAFSAMTDLLESTHEEAKILNVSRLDIAGQFPVKPADAIWAHINDRHPRIRQAPTHFFGTGLTWNGKGGLYGRLYDKVAERGRGAGDYVRMEWQLRKGVLKKAFTGDVRQTVLAEQVTFAKIYEVYRELCFGFCPQPLERVSCLYQMIFLGEQCGWKDDAGRSPLQIYQSGKSAKSVARYRKFVAGHRADLWKLDWREMLPADVQDAAILWEPEEAYATA